MTAVRRGLCAVGALVMAYAVIGALTDADVKFGALIFLVAVLVVHDGVLLPLAIGAGVLIGRLVPLPWRGFVRSALIIGLAVTIVAFPLVLGRGRAADNPSLLPLSYGRGLLEIYLGIAVSAAAAVTVRRRRERRRRPPVEPDADQTEGAVDSS